MVFHDEKTPSPDQARESSPALDGPLGRRAPARSPGARAVHLGATGRLLGSRRDRVRLARRDAGARQPGRGAVRAPHGLLALVRPALSPGRCGRTRGPALDLPLRALPADVPHAGAGVRDGASRRLGRRALHGSRGRVPAGHEPDPPALFGRARLGHRRRVVRRLRAERLPVRERTPARTGGGAVVRTRPPGRLSDLDDGHAGGCLLARAPPLEGATGLVGVRDGAPGHVPRRHDHRPGRVRSLRRQSGSLPGGELRLHPRPFHGRPGHARPGHRLLRMAERPARWRVRPDRQPGDSPGPDARSLLVPADPADGVGVAGDRLRGPGGLPADAEDLQARRNPPAGPARDRCAGPPDRIPTGSLPRGRSPLGAGVRLGARVCSESRRPAGSWPSSCSSSWAAP